MSVSSTLSHMRKHEETPMPLVTAGHSTPGEKNEFFSQFGTTALAIVGLVAVVAVGALLVLWLA
jgi:hypothetical protein